MQKDKPINSKFGTQKASIKFIVATDVHLGHKENHQVRKNDSFLAFEEVLLTAKKQDVDFVLLGGDLFDEVNPTKKTIYKCLDILQNYVQGQSKNNLKAKFLGDDDYRINFDNQNMNISLPVFTIHGNHDYPNNDFGKLSICDLLHVSKYANYFGKHMTLDQIIIRPMIIQKLNVKKKIAIYGLGYIKDAALNDLFQKKKVKFMELQNKQEYFCLFIFHQNRYKKGLRAGAPELKCINSKHIPTWMDLTIWGHEHQAINKVQIQDQRKIFQPGSTIITSFIEAQSYPKQTLLVEVPDSGEQTLTPIILQISYRPMICKNYQICQFSDKQKSDFFLFLDNQLARIIKQTAEKYQKKKPIIRIKVQHTGFQITRYRMLEIKYHDMVANPQSLVQFWKRKEKKARTDKPIGNIGDKQYISQQFKQTTDEILQIFGQFQQNQQVYYNPKELIRYMQTTMKSEFLSPQQYANGFYQKEINKKKKQPLKQIESFYKIADKRMHSLRSNEMKQILNNLKDDIDQVNLQQNDQQKNSKIGTSRAQWLQDKNFLLQKVTNNKSLLTNYGTNFMNIQQNQPSKQKISQNSKQRLDNKKQKPSYQEKILNERNIQFEQEKWDSTQEKSYNQDENSKICFKNTKKTEQQKIRKNKQKISEGDDEEYIPLKMEIEGQNKPKIRQNIFKNLSVVSNESTKSKSEIQSKLNFQNDKKIMVSESQFQQSSEDDCCKKAEKTDYNEIITKNNFEAADKIVRGKNQQKVKKQVKQKKEEVTQKKEQKKVKQQEKRQKSILRKGTGTRQSKSVRWSDSQQFN